MLFAVLVIFLFAPGLIAYYYLGGWFFAILLWLISLIYILFQISRKWTLVLNREILRQLMLIQGGVIGVGMSIILARPANPDSPESFLVFSMVMFLISMITDLIYLAILKDDLYAYSPISIVMTTIIVMYYVYALMGIIFFLLSR